jgi:cell division control protein 6
MPQSTFKSYQPIGGRSNIIFKDQSKLSFDYVPEELPHRDKQYQQLMTLFQPVLSSPRTQNAFITGGIGTGKTVLSKRFCEDLRKHAIEHGKNVDYVHINCRLQKSDNDVILKILTHFDQWLPVRGLSLSERLNTLRRHLDTKQIHLIVVLDEADVLIKKSGSDLIYALTRFGEEERKLKGLVSVILISQKYALDYLDPSTLSTFKRTNVIKLGKYTESELFDILEQRVELAFQPGVVQPGVTDMIATMAAPYGDARLAIEFLEGAGQAAVNEGADSVMPEHARIAKAHIRPYIDETMFAGLDAHQLLTLLSIARTIRHEAYVTTGKVEDMYKVICEEYGTVARGHTRFWTYLKELDAQGVIHTRRSGEGMAGQTTLISLPDIPAQVLEEYIVNLLETQMKKTLRK